MNLSLYRIDEDYCNYLRKTDFRVPYNMDEKHNRPFIGVVVSINDVDYFAPLSSPKPKHKTMKNQVDFRKLKGGEWGAINFNNMIPATKEVLIKLNLNIETDDDKKTIKYKELLRNQISWCNSRKDEIREQAKALYDSVTHKTCRGNLLMRCCDFLALESVYRDYIKHEDYVEDLHDLKAYKKALSEFEKDQKTYTLEEVERELQ